MILQGARLTYIGLFTWSGLHFLRFPLGDSIKGAAAIVTVTRLSFVPDDQSTGDHRRPQATGARHSADQVVRHMCQAPKVERSPHQPGNSAWQRYDVKGSVGPRYQLQFSYSNLTDWAKLHSHTNEKWFLRIDDQAMIPAALVDEEELHYQAWYQARYPEMNAIRLNQTYLDEEFLGDPEAIQVPADTTFHMSHCVRAVRRYWQAKETGRHVCARDIDYQHVKHCLDALDMWAFPEGPRGSVEMTSNKMLPEDTTRLVQRCHYMTRVM
jgi:hypothetical protein